jgi:hypothetical protein
LGYIPRSGIAGSYSVSTCSFLMSFHDIFNNGCINLHSHQQCMRVPFPLHPHQYLSLFVFFMVVILTGVRWNLNMVLICISFMAMDVQYLFRYFLAIWISSPFSMILDISLFYRAFIMLSYIPSIPCFLRAFIMKWCWILLKAFSASVEVIMWFLSLLLLICSYYT